MTIAKKDIHDKLLQFELKHNGFVLYKEKSKFMEDFEL